MISLNKTVLLHLFLLINIVYVICPTREQVKKCKDEIYAEFERGEPFDDLLHAFLHIKYHTVYWNERTNHNDSIYIGKKILKLSAGGYLNELFNIVLELGLPELSTPRDFCSTQNEFQDCINLIAEIGCHADFSGPDCFEKMYFNWIDLKDALPGTEYLSDVRLLKAIYKASEYFRNLSDDDLFEAFSSRPDILESLTDEKLLDDFHIRHYPRNHPFWNSDYLPGSQLREFFDESNTSRARLERYGIDLRFEVIRAEYQRRKSGHVLYDSLYALDIWEKMRRSSWDTSCFTSREDYCVKYLSELE